VYADWRDRHEHRGPGHAHRAGFRNILHERLRRQPRTHNPFLKHAAPVLPCRHGNRQACGNRKGKPAAINYLEEVGAEVREVEGEKDATRSTARHSDQCHIFHTTKK